MIRVKICGIRTFADALFSAESGADMLGFNFYPKTPRYIAPDAAREIVRELRQQLGEACPLLVGVFVNESAAAMLAILDSVGLDAAQLSGDEPLTTLADLGGRAIKALRPRHVNEACEQAVLLLPHAPGDERLPSLLVDAYHKDLYGGTGEQTSVEIALGVKAIAPRLMLAGGLTPENVAARVQAIRPWGVDVASGVENGQPGIKDRAKVRAFIEAVRAVE